MFHQIATISAQTFCNIEISDEMEMITTPILISVCLNFAFYSILVLKLDYVLYSTDGYVAFK